MDDKIISFYTKDLLLFAGLGNIEIIVSEILDII